MPETSAPTTYPLAPTVVARFVGLGLVALALMMFVGTALVAVLGLPPDALVALLVLGLAGVLTLAWWLRSRAWVIRCTDEGYAVRLVRGAGVREAAWAAVEDASTTTRHDVPCVVLRLKDGGTTTIPVGVLAVDKEEFVREVQGRLQLARGLRPYAPPTSTGARTRVIRRPRRRACNLAPLFGRRRLVRSMAPAC